MIDNDEMIKTRIIRSIIVKLRFYETMNFGKFFVVVIRCYHRQQLSNNPKVVEGKSKNPVLAVNHGDRLKRNYLNNANSQNFDYVSR